MTIELKDLDNVQELSAEAISETRGGMWVPTRFGWQWFAPRFSPLSRYAMGYGGFTNQFQRGTLGFGIQAATFAGQALNDQRHATFMANF